MKHLIFPSTAQADAFVQDLLAQGVIQPETRQASFNRQSQYSGSDTRLNDDRRDFDGTGPVEGMGGGTAEDAGEGAVKGTVAGAVAGGVVGAVATAASGGLLLPVVLGMTALGSGVGAGVGAIGGAAGVDETGSGGYGAGAQYVDDDRYSRMEASHSSGGRAIAVEDSVPDDVVRAAAARHGGELI
ncbi:hypothetical protein [Deinococcus sonorensis]|uniref:General stress protein 17M-like domain-containing protein n=2 Tax=Deinococcus sonorensis TaxID=309891 RepID=A0AAU7UEY4_9DEIO